MLTKLLSIRFLKISLIIISILIIITFGLWLALPGFLKNYIETNDKEWVNRDITINKINLNPFTTTLILSNVSITEPNSATEFLNFDQLLVNLNIWPLIFNNEIHIQEIKLSNLLGNIVQTGTQFNFSDLLNTKNSEEQTASEPLEFNLQNISIVKSSIHYKDTQIGSHVVLDSISIKDQKISSVDTVFDTDVAIHQPVGGWIKGTVTFNLENKNYGVDTTIENWELSPYKSYITSTIQLSEFSGQLNTDMSITGNTNTDFIKTSGDVSLDNFKIVDPEEKPLITVGKFFVGINEINSQENIYNFKDILINDSNISFEYLPNGDNFTKWLVTNDSDTITAKENPITDYYVSPFEMLSVYIYDMTKEYIFKAYTAENILFSNLNLKFYDYTLEDPFYMDLNNVSINSKNIKPENQFADFKVNGTINKTGTIKGEVSVSRQGVENMVVNMDVNGLFLNRFSPYGRFYTAHHLLEGISSFNNKSTIKDSYLKSTNEIYIEKIKVSKKDKTRSGYSLPLRLAVALMKDSKGNINLEIPVEGPLNDPKYKFGKVIWQVVKNLFTKMVTSPVKALSNVFNVNENDLKNVYFDNGQPSVGPVQKKTLDAIASVLKKKPELTIELNHLYNKEYEIDAIALKNAKLAYLKQADLKLKANTPIGKQAFKLPTTDPKFLEYLKTKTPNYDETISIPENARRLLGQETVINELITASEKQKQATKDYLIIEKKISEKRFTINDLSDSEKAINQSRPKFEVTFGVEK